MANEDIIIDKSRENDLDIAKGIGIILVVWAHAQGPFSSYIVQFHMPFFFFISGMLYRNQKRSIKEYTINKVKSLLIPFWFWNLLLFPFSYLIDYWNNWSILSCAKQLGGIIFTLTKTSFLGATWFLPALFEVSVFLHVLLKIIKIKNSKLTDYIIGFLGIAVCFVGIQYNFPYNLSRTMICFLFYISGYLYQKYMRDRINPIIKNIMPICFFVLFVFFASNNYAKMGNNEYKNKLLFIVGAYFAISFFLWVSNELSRYLFKLNLVKHVSYLGQNSIYIVIWQFVLFKVVIIVQMLIYELPVVVLNSYPIYDSTNCWWIIYLLVGTYGSILIKILLEKSPIRLILKKIYVIR